MGELTGRTAVVTGASRGIGAGIAAALAADGVQVALLARNEAKLRELSSTLKRSIPVACDVTRADSVARASETISREFGGAPDILVNNAGIFGVAAVEETSPDFFVETINTNLVGPFLFVRAFLGGMKEKGSGHVVTIGSIADRTIYTGNAAYSAAKFGVRAIHEVMRAELRASGVRATLVSPAATDTAIWDTVTITDPGANPRSKRPMLAPDDVVRAVMFALTQPERVNIDELRLSHS
ncbi:MAG TPA: SDR family NAD(P)-dependent oxidoreductase [Gemmatimonadaceae bacterium]|nr:SDR family NAD(P)-dependent oxidoreductase [Gemmatimonadaceae bacterium]